MFCKYCGNEITENMQFCSKCGNSTSMNNTGANNTSGNNAVGNNLNNANMQNQQIQQNSNAPSSASSAPIAPSAAPPAPPTPPAPPKEKGKKKNVIFITVLAVVLIAAVSASGWLLYETVLSNMFDNSSETSQSETKKDEDEEKDSKKTDKDETDNDEKDDEKTDSGKGDNSEKGEEEETDGEKSGKGKNGQDEDDKDSETETPQRPNIEYTVNTVISAQKLGNDVAVAVIDNKTGEKYLCNGASDSFVSWGFYLPVYMTFCDLYPNDYSAYKQDIMGSNISKCNTASNFAIDACGGPSGVTDHLKDKGYDKTVCGRYYGDTKATTDNYTCAEEAVYLLNKFNEIHNRSALCYDPAYFGVTVPAGASMNAHFGTENINQKNNLNVFAIVKGNKSDYSIVVLTKNRASAKGIINTIISIVHEQMEGNI